VAIGQGPSAHLVLGKDSGADAISSVELLNTDSGQHSIERPLPADQFTLTCDEGIVWWAGCADGARAAIVSADDDVYLLPPSTGQEIRSEQIRPGETIAVVNGAFVEAVPDVEFAFETALSGQIPPALGCAWLIELAAGDGASSPLLTAVMCPGWPA